MVHGEDGLDEISTTGRTVVGEVRDGAVRVWEIVPEDAGLARATLDDLRGGEPAENAAAMRRVFAGEPGPLADVTAFNAGAALYVGGAAPSIRGRRRARRRAAAQRRRGGQARRAAELLGMSAAADGRDGGGVPDVLARIVAVRRSRLAAEPAPPHPVASPEREAPLTAADNRFLAALATVSAGRAAIIAEVKMGSPRIGSLAGRVDPEAQARLYAAGGAAALSVVVEPDFFGGSYELLARCRAASGLPAIAKDFLVDERQLAWAQGGGRRRACCSSPPCTTPPSLRRAGRGRARGLGLAPLVETHGAGDLAKLAGAEWELVGVNNRDLRTFEVDLEHSIACLPRAAGGGAQGRGERHRQRRRRGAPRGGRLRRLPDRRVAPPRRRPGGEAGRPGDDGRRRGQ